MAFTAELLLGAQAMYVTACESLGHGIGYKYAHDYPNHYVKQQYLPSEIEGEHFYELSDMGYEKKLKEHMKKIHEEAE